MIMKLLFKKKKFNYKKKSKIYIRLKMTLKKYQNSDI